MHTATNRLNRIRRISLAAFAGLLAWGAAGSARAAVVYDTFGPNNAYNGNTPIFVSPGASVLNGQYYYTKQSVAVPFAAGANETFDAVTIASYYYLNDNSAKINLMSSGSDGMPSQVLETLTGDWGTVDNPPRFVSTTHPQLTVGELYWIAVAPGDNSNSVGLWFKNNMGYDGYYAVSPTSDVGPYTYLASKSALPAMRIEATATPEPASLTLAAGGLLALRRRRRA